MKPTPCLFNFSKQFTPRRKGMAGRCALPGNVSPSFLHAASLTLAVTLVCGGGASAQNVWTGATSGVLNLSGNYAAGASVNSDGNDTAVFVFGRNATNNRSLTATAEFKVNRIDFEGADSFTLANTGVFNFVKASNGITQSSSANQTISGGIKISDGPLTLGGNGTGLVTLSGTSNDFGGKGVAKSGTSAFLITAAIANPGTVTINGGTLAFSGTGNLASAYQLRGGVIAASGTFSRTVGTGATSVNFAANSNGGFAAYGGALNVQTNLGTWGTTGSSLTATSQLILGSSIANEVVTLSSNLALGTAARTIQLVDNTNSANDSAAISGIISGTGGLTLTGAGNLALSNTNTYTGVTTIGSGVVLSVGTIGDGSTAGNLGQATNAAANLVLNGGTLRYTGATASTNRNFTLGAATTSAIHVSNALSLLTMTGASATTTGVMNKTGDGVLILSAANAHTGGTVLTTGTLRATTNAGALGNGTLTLSGGILDLVNDTGLAFGRNTTVTANAQINSRRSTTGAGVTHSLGTLSIGAQTLTTGTDATVSSGTAGITFGATTLSASGATFTTNASTLLTLGAITGTNTGFTVNGAGNTTIGGAISTGTGNLTKGGAGVLTLSAANTHSGGTILNTGTLRATTNAGALGTGTLTLSGGILDLVNDTGLAFGRNTTVTANAQINSRRSTTGAGVTHSLGTLSIGAQTLTTGTDATVSSGTAGITFGATTLSASGATFTTNASTLLTLGAITGTNASFTVNGAGNTTIGGVIGTGTGNLTKGGAGSLTLLATNTFSGTTIEGGLLQVGDGGTTGTLGGGSVAIATGAALRFNRSNDLTVSNVLSGAGSLTKLGGGVLTLTGTNVFSGGTTIDVGSLQVGDGGTTGSIGSGSVAIATGASLLFNRSDDLTVANVLSGAGSFTKLGASALTLTGTNTFSGETSINSGSVRIAADANLGTGNIKLAGGTLAATETFTLGSSRVISLTAKSTLDVAATKTLTFGGNLFGSGNLEKTGAGTLALGGSSADYSGIITLSAGELRLTAANILTKAVINQTGGKLIFGGGTPQERLDVFVPKISGSGGEISVGSDTVAVFNSNDDDDVLQSYSGQIRGSGGIRKQGSGLVTLSGKNDFTGQADIDDGTLLIDEEGELGGPAVIANNAVLIVNGATLSTVEVEAGGTLGGAGVVGGFATIEGIHSPGNSPGVQTFADGASYGGTSVFEWDLVQNFSDPTGRGTVYDGVNVTAGQLLIAAGSQSSLRFNLEGSTVNWSNSFWATDQQWLVFDNASAPSGIFGAPSLTVDSAGATLASLRPDATFSWGQVGNDVYLNYTIPEPSSALFTIAGVLGLSLRRRR